MPFGYAAIFGANGLFIHIMFAQRAGQSRPPRTLAALQYLYLLGMRPLLSLTC